MVETTLEALSTYPQKFNEYIQLVEKAFGYNEQNSFAIDFHPLVNPQNFSNCYMLMYKNNLIATCAVKLRNINLQTNHQVVFMGAIAVDEKFRNQGLGLKIVKEVSKLLPPCAWIGLWSEKVDFFSKFQFTPFAEQYFVPKNYLIHASNNLIYKKIPLSQLSQLQVERWKIYYQCLLNTFVTIFRSRNDWEEILNIKSADFLEIYHNENVVGYAVVNKGMDLRNIVHEFYVEEKYEKEALSLLNADFEIWLPSNDLTLPEELKSHNLLLAPGKKTLWNQWQLEFKKAQEQKKMLLISGLDSV